MSRSTVILLVGLAGAVGLWLWSRTQSGAAAVGSVVDTVSGFLSGPRGIRDNNPGNIRRSDIQWQGQLTQAQVEANGGTWDPTFIQFSDPAYGVRAIGHVLQSYLARGLATVNSIIRTYSATDDDAYVANVAAALGVGPDDVIDVNARLPDLATAIIQQENGEQPYDPASIQQWVYS